MVQLPAAVRRALDAYRVLLASHFGERLRELVLLGSHCRGEADEESDVDMLVVIDDLTEEERLTAFHLA
jgi:predicted nucleotidyltransferase